MPYHIQKFMEVLALTTISLSSIWLSSDTFAESPQALPNIAMPTLGGKQFWADAYVYAGWRIQHNIYTDHYRLLDPENVRRAWGEYIACKDVFDDIRLKKKIAPSSDHLVLLVHGIARSTGTFSVMQQALFEVGYDAVAISYPSTRATIEAHAEVLERILNNLEETTTVSFVTHSMGGLVVRQLLSTQSAWQERIKVNRVVQIAPPNQGSAVARWLEDIHLYKLLYGEAGLQLTPNGVSRLPTFQHPFGIIAGGKGNADGYNPLLAGDDDGTVRVQETVLDGATDFITVPEIHALISNSPLTIKSTISFLKKGCFNCSNISHK